MFHEGALDSILRGIKRLIPEPLFRAGARVYHPLLAWTGALRYGFPSRRITVIGVTGTKGKSTTVHLISRIFEHAGYRVAAIGSLGYKIAEREWPNTLKMTMPGRWKMQKFLHEAVAAGCTYAIVETPSEGLAQGRHLGVTFGCAVFTGIHPEHIEAHGNFEAYRAAKQLLFRATRGIHVVNADDASAAHFSEFTAATHATYGIENGDVRADSITVDAQHSMFTVEGERITLHIGGVFNVSNALAALTVAKAYGISVRTSAEALASISFVDGRMQWIQREPFGVVVDYAHTPDSLEAVYRTLRTQLTGSTGKLICVLGAAGGGRDAWKRPLFGALAATYCDRIILTDEDPYEEDPNVIIADVRSGVPADAATKVSVMLDRRAAIRRALTEASTNDIIIITGKGSETSMAIAGGRKVPWSDAQVVREHL